MRNRAKCALCEDIIESFHQHDYVPCKCGEISIDGGKTSFKASAHHWENFIRIDDNDKEIKPKIVDKLILDPEHSSSEKEKTEIKERPSKSELIEMLKAMTDNIEALPPHAMSLPINHYDFYSALLLIHTILSTPNNITLKAMEDAENGITSKIIG